MYIIAGVMGFIYLFIWVMAKRAHIPEHVYGSGNEKWMRPFLQMAGWIWYVLYDSREKKQAGQGGTRQVAGDLDKLYPGVERKALITGYYVRKLALVMVVVLVGTSFGTVAYWQAESSGLLQDGSNIVRGDYREPEEKMQLEAMVEGYGERTFQLYVGGRLPDKTEADRLEAEFWEALLVTALGDNASWNTVYEGLLLEESLEEYPFYVEWSSDSPHIVDDTGNVKEVEENYVVSLTADVSLEEWKWQHFVTVTVVPRPGTEEERIYMELEQFINKLERETKTDTLVILPESWDGKNISWKEQKENYGILLWLITVAAGVGVFFLQDKDLHTRVQARQQQLKEEYPVVVNKLVLYLGAGLTIRGAFYRLAEEYAKEKQRSGRIQPVYEEILCTGRELGTGASETEAYERFGKRCGLTEYVRLSALLSQNLRKGSISLSARLKEEADAALKEQINQSRRIGEEVSTRLLIPMVMMLGIVMVMIMIPAFGSF